MIFMREDKMTSSNYTKYELEVQKDQIERLFEGILKPTFNLELFGFYSNYFFPKTKLYGKQGKMIPYNRKMEKNSFEIILVFKK